MVENKVLMKEFAISYSVYRSTIFSQDRLGIHKYEARNAHYVGEAPYGN